jgi:hypothetical protein
MSVLGCASSALSVMAEPPSFRMIGLASFIVNR